MLEAIRSGVAEALRTAARETFGAEIERVVLERPPKIALGDLACPVAFDLAKALKKAPRAIATELAAAIRLPAGVKQARVEGGGYLNFFLDRGPVIQALAAGPLPTPSRAGKVIVEHTNINPNKAAHIGHLRNAVLGDVLVRALRHLGYPVEVQNYLDDTGVQVADVVVGLLHLQNVTTLEAARAVVRESRLPGGAANPKGFAYLCWDLYAEVGRTYAARPETKSWRDAVLHAIEEGDNETARIAALVVDAVVSAHLATMGRLGHRLRRAAARERHPPQALLGAGLRDAQGEGRHPPRDRGQARRLLGPAPDRVGGIRRDGGARQDPRALERHRHVHRQGHRVPALEVRPAADRLRLHGLHPGVESGSVREEEIPAAVLAHPIWRTAYEGGAAGAPSFGHGHRVFNVIDVRQSYPQKVVREGLRALGFTAEADRSVHFSYEMVALSPKAARELAERFGEEYRLSAEDEKKPFVEMSGRKGLGVKADDLVELLLERSRAEIASRRSADAAGGAPAAEQDARAIAIGALRYFLLKVGRNKIIAFDFDEALDFEGDTGPYLQYSLVRADNIFRKLEEKGIAADAPAAGSGQEWDDDLWTIALDAASTPDVAERAVDSLELATLARHAFGLAQSFNHFYHRQPILQEADAAVRNRRVAVARIFRAEMSRLLGLLGIPEPGRM